jgi:hypothetical protein
MMSSRVQRPMTRKNPQAVRDNIESDPFGERYVVRGRRVLQIMGGCFEFESDSSELLRLVDTAFKDLPAHQFVSRPPRFRIRLILANERHGTDRHRARRSQAPRIPMLHGAGFLGSATDKSTFVVLSQGERSALIFVSREMLRFPYHVRYEMIEFAVFTLACRAQGLVPLHAACIGLKGRAVLLMGPSGAGKTTVALQCLLAGFDFLAEDSVFVAPKTMRATGIANFLHVRTDSLTAIGSVQRRAIRRSPIITRRSGVQKFEVDLRNKRYKLAENPVKIIAVAFLSTRSMGSGSLMRRLPPQDTLARLEKEQGYAAGLVPWDAFSRTLSRSGVEILRGPHPSTTVEALRALLE